MPNNPNEKIRSTREEVGDNAIFNEAFRVLNEVRRKHGELLTVITPEVQAGTIYGNPEVFELFNRLEGLDVEEYEFLSGVVEEYISPDNTIVVLGSGWGMMSRGLARNRPDTKIVNVDINDEILSLDRQANQRSGFPNISSIHGDVTKIDDLEYVRVEIIGNKKLTLDCLTKANKKYNYPAGSYDTGVPPSIVAQMILKKKIQEKGVFPPDLVVPPELFFKELARRKIFIFLNNKRVN